MSKIISLSWKDIFKDIYNLTNKLKKYNFNKIIAVSRGGLVPAGIIANKLNIKYVDTICYQSYDNNNKQNTLELIKRPLSTDFNFNKSESKVLIIDDIVDTGNTFKAIKDLNKDSWERLWNEDNTCYASLYVKPQGKEFADEFSFEFGQKCWLIFPWEARNK